ncbi:MAG: hypothetical protein K0S47_1737 [Herbinix sp.]|jgi:Na+-transporting methylmalonyl-CoA/oxaloacetate decarboxylase gamma subunit|nr:hypothetical protein [Herbinix sp.]
MGILQSGIMNRTIAMLSANSLVERLEENSFYILIGMGISIVIILLTILLVYLVKVFPGSQATKTKSDQNNQAFMDNVIAQIVEQEENELIDDNELVAVITAAITASFGDFVPADGLVVRSIRKVNSNK